LTKSRIVAWHTSLANAPARKRSPAGKQRFRESKGTDAEIKSRRASANLVLAHFRAALNHAHAEGRAPIADAWKTVKPFKGVSSARVAFLNDDESRRLINASQGDFRNLVIAALMTGCRYGELARLLVEDFHADAGTIHVRISKSGKPRHIALTDEGQRFFVGLCLNKLATDLLLTFKDREWRKSDQQIPFETARKAVRLGPMSFHGLRHTYASKLVKGGASLSVVAAQLGHASIAMVERYYGHLAPSHIADTVRAKFGDLGIIAPTNVMKLPSTAATHRCVATKWPRSTCASRRISVAAALAVCRETGAT
jgi:integrase